MEYIDCVAELDCNLPELAGRIRLFTSLRHVLDWLTTIKYPLQQLDMMTQDEFCHDLIIPMPEYGHVLVFGMT